MADDEKNAPIFTEMFGKETGPVTPRLEHRHDGAPIFGDDGICPPLHRMHERRLVQTAGRMVIGVRMPTPAALEPQTGRTGRKAPPMFYSTPEKRGPTGASRAVFAVACAMALGGTAALTGRFSVQEAPPTETGAPQEKHLAGDVTSALPESRPPVQLMAISQVPVGATQVAARPQAAADRSKTSGSDLIRVAQKEAPGLAVEDIFGPAGKPIRLSINLNGTRLEDYSFLMFRGLPANVTLSAGFRLKESWAVSLRDLDNLTLEAPDEFQGSFNLEILLVKGRDTPAESRVITVEIVPENIQMPPATAMAQPALAPTPQVLTAAPRTIEPVERIERPVPAARPALPTLPPQQNANRTPASAPKISSQQEETMMRRATGLLENKDVMSARLLLEHLANNGSPKAALAMAKTFDPAFLRGLEASGLKPDVAKARQWYRRAADLGDQEAATRLNTLASR